MKVPSGTSVDDLDRTVPITHLSSSSPLWQVPRHVLGRLYLTVAVLLIEYTAIVSLRHPWCTLHQAVAGAIVFLAVFLFVATPALKTDRTPLELNARLLPFYGICLVIIAAVHFILLKTSWPPTPFVVVWFATIPLSAAILVCALIPPRVWPAALGRARLALIYAFFACLIATSLSNRVQMIWDAPKSAFGIWLQRTTFYNAAHVLRFFYSQVIVDPSTYTLSLPQFGATIGGTCSGIEGLALTLLFSVGWLWYARRELRFPHALLLVPVAMTLIWLLNILRIVVLFIIGNSGHPGVAIVGFHSEAGWIAFNTVSLLFLIVADRTPWLARRAATAHGSASLEAPAPAIAAQRNVAAIYLTPFLAILAAAMLSKASTSGFEWLYPLRFFAAAAVLWHYRAEYRRMDWKFGWLGPTVGALVFLMWLAISRWTAASAPSNIGPALAAMPAIRRIGWLVVRIAAAVITVPIAEELAFRGFLMRRIESNDPESIAYSAVTPLALVLSSVVFGALHGNLWIAGIVAGLAYALVVKRTGRLGEAVAAHSTTNLLLAVWVLTRGDWGLW